jgi:hypothetical protein
VFSPSAEDGSDTGSSVDVDEDSDDSRDEERDEEDESSSSDASSTGSSRDMHRMIAQQLVGLFTLTSAQPARGGFRGLYYELRQRLQFVRDLCAMESRLDNSDDEDEDEAEAALNGDGDDDDDDDDAAPGSSNDSSRATSTGSNDGANDVPPPRASAPRVNDSDSDAAQVRMQPVAGDLGGRASASRADESPASSMPSHSDGDDDTISDVALVTRLLQAVRRLDTLAHNLVQQLKRMRVMSADAASPTVRDEEIPEPPENRAEAEGTDIGTWMLHVAVTATEMVQLALLGRGILARGDAECLAALEAQELKILLRRAHLDAAMGRTDAAFESVNEALAMDGRSVDGIVLAARLALHMGIDVSYLVQMQALAQAALRGGAMAPSARAMLRRLVDDLQRAATRQHRRGG